MERVIKKELYELILYKSTLFYQPNINTENYHQDQGHLHHLSIGHPRENLLKKICKILKFLLVYQTGKTQEVIPFQFI